MTAISRRRAIGALAAGAIALARPASARQTEAADGYVFERKEYTVTDLHLRIVEHPNYRDLLAAMPPGAAPRSVRKVRAWSNIAPDGHAEIHIVDPLVSYAPAALGHELAHAIYGRWHA